jgi:hypothetical protein
MNNRREGRDRGKRKRRRERLRAERAQEAALLKRLNVMLSAASDSEPGVLVLRVQL